MKNLFLSLAFVLIGSSAFANTAVKSNSNIKKNSNSTKKVLPPQATWQYRCSDGEVTRFTCGCTTAQATSMGRAWCDAR